MLSFQKPGPLGFECRDIFNVIIEWSVLKPGRMFAEVMLPRKL